MHSFPSLNLSHRSLLQKGDRHLSCSRATKFGVPDFVIPNLRAVFAFVIVSLCALAPIRAEAITAVVVGDDAITGASGTVASFSYSLQVTDPPVERAECTTNSSSVTPGPWSGPTYEWDPPGNTGGIVATVSNADTISATLTVKFIKPGNYTIGMSGEVSYSSSCGDAIGSDSKSINVVVTEGSKAWTSGSIIGAVLDTQTLEPRRDNQGNVIVDGRITAPQDQTQSPVDPERVIVAPLRKLSCGAEAATDYDAWTLDRNSDGQISTVRDDDEKGIGLDSTVTTWSSSAPYGGGGGFVMQDEEGNITLVSSIASNAPNFAQWTGQWQAPSVAQSCTLTVTHEDVATVPTTPDTGVRDDGALAYSVQVVVYSASAQFLSGKVAAGAVDNDSHKARFFVRITDREGNILSGVKVEGAVDIIDGGWGSEDSGQPGPQDDSVSATASLDVPPTPPIGEGDGGVPPSPPSPTTDGEGKVYGSFRSGHRIEPLKPTVIIVRLNGDNSGPTAQITQVWNELSHEQAWEYDPYFYLGEPSPVAYKIQYQTGVDSTQSPIMQPITGHAVKFETTRIDGWEWNPNIGEDWTGPNDEPDGIVDGDYEYKSYSKAQAEAAQAILDASPTTPAPPTPVAITGWNRWKGLSSFDPTPAEEGEEGTYGSDQTVVDGFSADGEIDFATNYVGFDAVDDTPRYAYSPN
jgi:hypothetical protein